jgi:hypothetical protein
VGQADIGSFEKLLLSADAVTDVAVDGVSFTGQ